MIIRKNVIDAKENRKNETLDTNKINNVEYQGIMLKIVGKRIEINRG